MVLELDAQTQEVKRGGAPGLETQRVTGKELGHPEDRNEEKTLQPESHGDEQASGLQGRSQSGPPGDL